MKYSRLDRSQTEKGSLGNLPNVQFQMEGDDNQVFIQYRMDGSPLAGLTNSVLELKAIQESEQPSHYTDNPDYTRALQKLNDFFDTYIKPQISDYSVDGVEGKNLVSAKKINESLGAKFLFEVTQDEIRDACLRGTGRLIFQLYAGANYESAEPLHPSDIQ